MHKMYNTWHNKDIILVIAIIRPSTADWGGGMSEALRIKLSAIKQRMAA